MAFDPQSCRVAAISVHRIQKPQRLSCSYASHGESRNSTNQPNDFYPRQSCRMICYGGHRWNQCQTRFHPPSYYNIISKSIYHSTCEAEYVTAAEAARQAISLKSPIAVSSQCEASLLAISTSSNSISHQADEDPRLPPRPVRLVQDGRGRVKHSCPGIHVHPAHKRLNLRLTLSRGS